MKDTSRNDWKLEKLIAFLLSLLFLLPFVARAAAPETRFAALYLSQPDSGEAIPARTVSTDVHLVVTGQIARGSMTQLFRNVTHDCVDGTYILPLPHGARVDSVRLTIGKLTDGEIREKNTEAGRDGAPRGQERDSLLVDQSRADVLRVAVPNFLPGAEALVEIMWEQPVELTDTTGSLSLPVAIAPRFASASRRGNIALPEDSPLPELDASGDAATDPRVTIRVDLPGGVRPDTIRSPGHPAAVVEAVETGWTLRTSSKAPARNFVVQWDRPLHRRTADSAAQQSLHL